MIASDSSHRHFGKADGILKDPKDNLKIPIRHRNRSATVLIEEAVVNLHALCHYYEESLTPNEKKFVAVAKKNLAVIHRRLNDS